MIFCCSGSFDWYTLEKHNIFRECSECVWLCDVCVCGGTANLCNLRWYALKPGVNIYSIQTSVILCRCVWGVNSACSKYLYVLVKACISPLSSICTGVYYECWCDPNVCMICMICWLLAKLCRSLACIKISMFVTFPFPFDILSVQDTHTSSV